MNLSHAYASPPSPEDAEALPLLDSLMDKLDDLINQQTVTGGVTIR